MQIYMVEWNVRGITNKHNMKEVTDIFKKGNLEILDGCETSISN